VVTSRSGPSLAIKPGRSGYTSVAKQVAEVREQIQLWEQGVCGA